MRIAAAGALAVLAFAAPAQAKPQAVIAFLPLGPGETRPLVEELAARGMAVGMTSPTVGGFKARQMGLDMSQGARIPTRLYSKRIGSLVLHGGRLEDWAVALRRADKAPGDLKPGLLASTIEGAGGRVGYAGPDGFQPAAIVAADRRGRVVPARPGDALDVIRLAPGAAGLRELDRVLASRPAFVYVVRAPYGKATRLLPSGVAGLRGVLRSATTRRDGLIAGSDVAPTVLDVLGVPVPDAMQGERIEGRGGADPEAVESLDARLSVVTSRRGPTLLWLLGAWLVLLVLLRREALRVGLLAALWVPAVGLLTAAIEPSALAEEALIGVGSVLLGLATDRLVPWPGAPAIPAAVVFIAHALDLAAGSSLIGRSIAGPNPAGGARFFGIGNELETILSVSVLIGTGAALAWRAATDAGTATDGRRVPLAFAAAAIVAGIVMGAGRLGADVGAVITLGAGGAAAVVASLPGGPSRRAIALGIAAPVAAVLALIVIDLVTGGGAHLTRSVLHAHDSGDIGDVVRRRFAGSFSGLKKPVGGLAFLAALAAVVWLAARGRAVLAGCPRPFAAGLVGAWFAVVIGALANDSGPLILEIGAILLLLAHVYAAARPAPAIDPR